MKRLIALILAVLLVTCTTGLVSYADNTTIDGDANIVTPYKNILCGTPYAAKDGNGNTVSAVWSIEGTDTTDMSITDSGLLKFGKDAVAGAKTIVATVNGTRITKTITVYKGKITDFETPATSVTPGIRNDTGAYATVKTDNSGNTYVDAYRGTISLPTPATSTDRIATLKWKMRVPSAKKYSGAQDVYDRMALTIIGSSWWQYLFFTRNADGTATISSYDNLVPAYPKVTYNGTYPMDSWIDFKLVVNNISNTYDLYISGVKVKSTQPIPTSNTSPFSFASLILSADFDDFQVYSGNEIIQTLNVSVPAELNVPQGKELKSITLQSEITEDGVTVNRLPMWTLDNSYAGVTLSGNKLTMDSTASGTIGVTAKLQNSDIVISKTINLLQPYPNLQVKGSDLIINGDPSTKYKLTILKPKNIATLVDSFLECYTENDTPITPDMISLQTDVITDASGKASYCLSTLNMGLYRVVVENYTDIKVSCMNYVSKLSELITDPNNMADEKFKTVLANNTLATNDDINTSFDLYKAVSYKENVVKLMKGEIGNFYLSTYLQNAIELQTLNTDTINNLKQQLQKGNYDTMGIDLLCKNAKYAQTTDVIIESTFNDITSFLANVKEISILQGVYTCVNYKDSKAFLAEINNSKYNNATDEQKNTIALAVYGKLYTTISALSLDVDAVNLSAGSGSSGGGSGGGRVSIKPKSSTSFSGDIVPATPVENQIFRDVDKSYWGYKSIQKIANMGIVNGNNGLFLPENKITRAEFIKILCQAFSLSAVAENCFSDVNVNDWYAPYVTAAKNRGLAFGDNGNFYPQSTIKREDAATLAYRFSKNEGINFLMLENKFSDDSKISDYAKQPIYELCASDVINGVGNNIFSPDEKTTRAEAIMIVYNILKRVGRVQ